VAIPFVEIAEIAKQGSVVETADLTGQVFEIKLPAKGVHREELACVLS
jgi:hypothetical protein